MLGEGENESDIGDKIVITAILKLMIFYTNKYNRASCSVKQHI